jgi:hypothetical protein
MQQLIEFFFQSFLFSYFFVWKISEKCENVKLHSPSCEEVAIVVLKINTCLLCIYSLQVCMYRFLNTVNCENFLVPLDQYGVFWCILLWNFSCSGTLSTILEQIYYI